MIRTRGYLSAQTRVCCPLLTRTLSTLPAGHILRSTSTDVFANLALEDWIHERVELQGGSVLLLWRSACAAVIGRHQNPWLECDMRLLRHHCVPVARRRSGGGAVYHDLGNLNMTFFTSKKDYNRRSNLNLVIRALQGLRPGLDVQVTDRYDILLNGTYKISGTAAKVGRSAAYHHCTLLCEADRTILSQALTSRCHGVRSNATPSVPSAVKNLTDEDPTLTCDTVMAAVASQYSLEHKSSNPVAPVDPTDELSYPGIHKITRDLQEWEWVYGRTPKFTLGTSFQVLHEDTRTTVTLDMEVKNGVIDNCAIGMPPDWLPRAVGSELSSLLAGCRFWPTEVPGLTATILRTHSLSRREQNKVQLLSESMADLM